MDLRSYSLRVIRAIENGGIENKRELNLFKIRLCSDTCLKAMPTNPDILSFAKKPSKKLLRLLSIKPVRSLSGVSPIAVMVKPHKCPGKCIYCPSGLRIETPKSYTGEEPASMRALTFNFDPFKQTDNRIKQLEAIGHTVRKIELILMGGTFLSTKPSYQEWFVKSCLDAITSTNSKSLENAKANAEKSRRRVIGITFETRPDICRKKEINRMLLMGGTRAELGVQIPSNRVYRKIKRGHTVKDVVDSTQLLKDSAFKVCYHIMPGLFGSTAKQDLKLFRSVFQEQQFKPDMLKIYPTLVIEGTELYKLWQQGQFKPLTTAEAAELISELKRYLPKWVRIMRIQRDIPATFISAGVDKSNLRQLVQKRIEEKGIGCKCIRCREAGLESHKKKIDIDFESMKMLREDYNASKGEEVFISAETQPDLLLGFCRLRLPYKPFRKEITDKSALIRGLHVYGKALPLGKKEQKAVQHKGIGKMLLEKAERIAAEEFDKNKIVIISGLGVREYYRKNFGYRNDGPYLSKKLG